MHLKLFISSYIYKCDVICWKYIKTDRVQPNYAHERLFLKCSRTIGVKSNRKS